MSAPPSPRVSLVTGASRGLGAAIARRLGADGMAVAVNYRSDRGSAHAVVAAIRDVGGTAEPFQADVTDAAQVHRLVDDVRRRLGDVDVLVVNATGPQPRASVEDLTWPAVVGQLDFFVKSPLLLVQAVVGGMKQRGRGRIVHIGSEQAVLGEADNSAYTAAKGAQLGLARSWARELAPFGITVNTVAPGWIPVERHAGAAPEDLALYRSRVPLGRMGTPDELADAVAFLASERASFVTGARLTVNGGVTVD